MNIHLPQKISTILHDEILVNETGKNFNHPNKTLLNYLHCKNFTLRVIYMLGFVLAVFETSGSAMESCVYIRKTSIILYSTESKSSTNIGNKLPIMSGSAFPGFSCVVWT